MNNEATIGVLDEFQTDLVDAWKRLPNKAFFFSLLAAWLALFQFRGNSILGYIHTQSLFAWLSESYNSKIIDEAHGNFIPFLVLGLLWMKRKELLGLELRLWLAALPLVAMALLLHMFGYVVQQPLFSAVALFFGFYSLTVLSWGPQWLRHTFFPFFLFVFSIPLGNHTDFITFRLRLLVCQLVEIVTHLLGINVIRSGTELFNPGGAYQYEVAAACSGMRSLIAVLLLSTVYGFLTFRSWPKRVLLIFLAVPFAVLGNLLRMLTIIFAAELGGQSAGNYAHDGGPLGLISLLPYVPAIVGVFLLGHWLREKTSPNHSNPGMNKALPKRIILGATLLLVVGTGLSLSWLKNSQKLGQPGIKAEPTEDKLVMNLSLPERVLDFTSTNMAQSDVVLGYLPKDTSFAQRRYTDTNGFWTVGNIISMGADRTSIHKPDYCLPGQGWRVLEKGRTDLRIEGPVPYTMPVAKWVAAMTTKTPEGNSAEIRLIYMFWFVADNEQTIDNDQRLRWLMRDLVTKRVLQRWAYVSYFAVCDPGREDAAFERMSQLIAASVPEFQLPPGPGSTLMAKD